MKVTVIRTALTLVCFLSTPPVLQAKGGGHGGGHSGGGHSAGGHAGGHSGSGHSGSGHSGSGHSGSGHASSGHSGGGHASGGQSAGSSRAGGPHGHAPSPASAPSAARSRDGHPIVGVAVPRTSSRSDLFLATPSTYAPHFISPFLGVGLYGRPFGFGQRYRSPWCWSAFDCALPAISGYGGMSALEPLPPESEASGNLRLDVQPMTAQVFVDGYYVGTVEDFSPSLAGLALTAGPHHLEFRAPGYETLAVDVQIQPSHTITYRTTLKPQQP